MEKRAKARPRTGERRQTNQPLKIDKLPLEVRDEILRLRNRENRTWQEIEELSALPKDRGGFVDWHALELPVLEMFPDLRIPHSNLHRWYDLRVSQVREDVMRRSAQAREIAEAFAKSTVANDDEAALNAARDLVMGILAEDGTPGGRMRVAKTLIALAEMLQERRLNDIKERMVAVDERKIAALEKREALARKKLEAETEKLQKKAAKGTLTKADLDRLTERTFGFRTKPEGRNAA